jgi:hypothetical protein
MLAICVGSVLLLHWSLFVRLLPVTRQHQDRATQMTRLADEVERLRLKWDPQAVELIRSRFQAARQSLFGGSNDLNRWRTGLEREAGSRALEAGLTLGEPQTNAAINRSFASVKAELEVWPLTVLGFTNSPYQRVLGYFDDVVDSPKRVDLIELSVRGNSNSIQQARAVLHLLAGDLAPTATNTAQP